MNAGVGADALGRFDPLHEALRGRAQGQLGVDVELPRDVRDREEKVSDLAEDV